MSDASPFAPAVSTHPLLFAVATWLALTWRLAGSWSGRCGHGHPGVALGRPRDEPVAGLNENEAKTLAQLRNWTEGQDGAFDA
jgi:hypothetical protein